MTAAVGVALALGITFLVLWLKGKWPRKQPQQPTQPTQPVQPVQAPPAVLPVEPSDEVKQHAAAAAEIRDKPPAKPKTAEEIAKELNDKYGDKKPPVIGVLFAALVAAGVWASAADAAPERALICKGQTGARPAATASGKFALDGMFIDAEGNVYKGLFVTVEMQQVLTSSLAACGAERRELRLAVAAALKPQTVTCPPCAECLKCNECLPCKECDSCDSCATWSAISLLAGAAAAGTTTALLCK